MGYGITILSIILFVDLLVYFGASATGNSLINPPVIAVLQGVATGDLAQLIPSVLDFNTLTTRFMVIALIVVAVIALNLATGSYSITGVGGQGLGVTQLPMIIGVFIFLQFATMPNFAVMGFPTEVATALYVLFGAFEVIGIYGIIRGD